MSVNSTILIIAVIVWGIAMLRLLPRAWRLDRNRTRLRPGRSRRLPLEAVRLRAQRLQAARA